MSFKSYIHKVRLAAQARVGEPLYNGSYDHAAVLTAAMFEHATSKVSIFSGRLDAKVYGREDVLEMAKIFLSAPDNKLRVVVEAPEGIDAVDHPFVSEFKDNNDVEFKVLSDELGDLPYHFTVMDDDSYRFEADKTVPSAVAAFGNREVAGRLNHIFDVIWQAGKPLNF